MSAVGNGRATVTNVVQARHAGMSRFPRKAALIAFALAQLAVVGWLDYITSYEVSVAVLYYLPIAFAAWYIGWNWSFGLSLLCAATLTWAELAGGRHYSHGWIIWERTFIRMLALGFVAFSFNFFKRTLERERAKFRQLEGMLSICNCCHRIRDDHGYWTELATFLREHGDVQPQSKLCPECARQAYAKEGRP